MKRMGFEITGNLDHMATATNTGIHNVRHVMPEAFAELMTGATISATTTGRMPLNIAERVGLDVIVSGVRNIAIARIIRNDGSMVPGCSCDASAHAAELVANNYGHVHGEDAWQ